MENTEPEVKIKDLIDTLLRKGAGDVRTFVSEVKTHMQVDETKTVSHCYVINLDANGRPRVSDLAQFVALHMIDYSIPRKDIALADKID